MSTACASGRVRAVVLVVPLLGLLGCATLWKMGLHYPDGGRDCRGALLDAAGLPDGLRLREQVRVRAAPDVDWGLSLVAEKQGDTLVVVGLDGFGGRLFTIVQRADDVTVERAFGRRMPWPPQNVLSALEVARLGAPPGEGVVLDQAPRADGRAYTVVRDARCGSETTLVGSLASAAGAERTGE